MFNQSLWSQRLSELACFSQFPVSLTIKLICSNKDGSLPLCRIQQNTVSREPLVLVDFEDISYFHTLTCFESPCLISLQVFVLCVVDVFVFAVALDVVDCLLDQSDSKYENQWRYIGKHETHF